jgi:hypothetical protein
MKVRGTWVDVPELQEFSSVFPSTPQGKKNIQAKLLRAAGFGHVEIYKKHEKSPPSYRITKAGIDYLYLMGIHRAQTRNIEEEDAELEIDSTQKEEM